MPTVVPESSGASGSSDWAELLGEALEGLLEFTGATAGWVGLCEADGRLTFPARRGEFPDTWLSLQQGRDSVWGFEVREGPTLLNELGPLAPAGDPPLTNLLSCPLGLAPPRGHVVLANKPSGFTSHDASVLLAVAHLLGRQVIRARPDSSPAFPWPVSLTREVLDNLSEAVLVVEEAGTLVFANATWLRWTGFEAGELIARPAPFPFWVSHRDLATLGSAAGPQPTEGLPFRRRDESLFWCDVRPLSVEWQGKRFTVAVLKQAPGPATVSSRLVAVPVRLDELPFGLVIADRAGRVLWANPALDRLVPRSSAAGVMLRDRFGGNAALVLDRVLREATAGRPGRSGWLLLPRVSGEPLQLVWLAVPTPEGPGLLLALAEEAEGFPTAESPAGPSAGLPATNWMSLLLQPGAEIGFWDERWQQLTGLRADDLAGVQAEAALDWLFPHQRDRDLVADWLHEPARAGGQAVLQVLTRGGSKPLLCTLLPVGGPGPAAGRWLLLAGEPDLYAGEASPSLRFVRQFTRGLGRLLNHYLGGPLTVAENALDRPDLSAEVTGWFGQVLESCQHATRLVSALEDLSSTSVEEAHVLPLADVVRQFLDDLTASRPEMPFELVSDLSAAVLVRVNRRMIRVVLEHLVRNAEDAVAHSARRQVEVRVHGDNSWACCEVHDTGEGLPTEDWTRPLAPFFSTKGAFARDSAHARQEATGLGLTVCQHLLALHGGRVELRGGAGRGTTAVVYLPRADQAAGRPAEGTPAPATVRSRGSEARASDGNDR